MTKSGNRSLPGDKGQPTGKGSASLPTARPERTRATSYDVALLAGVSQSAVSRCFKPGASISAKMRIRIMAAAKELDYQPNAIARGLITRRSNLVAVLVSARVNLYYPEVLFKLTEELSAADLRVLLFTIDSDEHIDLMLGKIWQYQVDGVISATNISLKQYKQIEGRSIPTVMFNRYFPEYPTNVVYCDPTRQTTDLIEQLFALGHRRFGIVLGPDNNTVSHERRRIVLDALKHLGITDVATAPGDFTYESGGQALQSLLNTPKPPTAIICVNDMMALGCIDEARGVLTLAVPGQLSVASFDGIGMSQFEAYRLTTIRQPIGRMASAAVEILLDRIQQQNLSNERRVFEGIVIPGETIGPAPTA